MPTTIYALCEPDLQVPVIRYIGKSIAPKKRYQAHLSQSVKEPNRLGRWLQKLTSRNEKPVMLPMWEIPDDLASDAEIFCIWLARSEGLDLVNATDGGDGCVNPTPETRAKVRESKLGSRNPNFGGVPAATLAAAGAANRLRVLTPEAREALRESKRGVKNPNFGKVIPKQIRAAMSVGQKEAWILRKMPYFSDGGGI